MKNILVKPNFKIIQAMKRLAVTGERCLIVTDKKNKLLGTLNDGDVRRGILQGINTKHSIKTILLLTLGTKTLDLKCDTEQFKSKYKQQLQSLVCKLMAGEKYPLATRVVLKIVLDSKKYSRADNLNMIF